MSVASIIARGYGSFSAVKFLPTRGYLSGTPATPPTPTGGAADKGDPDRRKLLAKIKWLESKKRLETKERRELALYRHQLDQKEIEEKVLAELPIPMKEDAVNLQAIHIFNELLAPNIGSFRGSAFKGIHIDITGEDEEIEEWLLLGD